MGYVQETAQFLLILYILRMLGFPKASFLTESTLPIMSNPSLKTPVPPSAPIINLSDRLAPGTRIGRFCIGQWLASGGTADVYTCYAASSAANPDPPDQHRHVVKVFRFQGDFQQYDRRLRLFEKEVHTLRALSGNIHIATVFEDGELVVSPKLVRPYYVLPRLTGGTLTSHIHHHPLSEKDTCKLTLGLMDALHFAHQRGFLHCDVKPDNVMLDESQNPVWIDFGIAKELDMATDAISIMSEVGSVAVGTAPYMSPEHFAGRHTLSPQSDVWSIGVLMLRMLTRQYPFGMHFEQVRQRTLFQRWQSIEQLPAFKEKGLPVPIHPHMKAILLKCLQVELEDRYETALQLKQDLLAFQDGRIPKYAMPTEAAQAEAEAQFHASQAQAFAQPQPPQPSYSNYAPFPTSNSGNMQAYPPQTISPQTMPLPAAGMQQMNMPMATSNPYTMPYAMPQEKKTNWAIIIAAGLGFLLVAVLLVWMMTRSSPQENIQNQPLNPSGQVQTPPNTNAPSNTPPNPNAIQTPNHTNSAPQSAPSLSSPAANVGSNSVQNSVTTPSQTVPSTASAEEAKDVFVQFAPVNGFELAESTVNGKIVDGIGGFSQPFSFKTNQSINWSIKKSNGTVVSNTMTIPKEYAGKTVKLDWTTGKISL
jgi:serine/threonine protein kinase